MHGSFTGPRQLDVAAELALDGSAPTITVPDAGLLFRGDFKRSGDNLKITGDDGKAVIVADYFKSDRLATLLSPDGAALVGDVVNALAGPQNPGQYAQAGTPASSGGQEIGRVATVQGSAVAVRNGVAVALNVGDAVLKGDVVQTQGGGSALGIICANQGSPCSGGRRIYRNNERVDWVSGRCWHRVLGFGYRNDKSTIMIGL